MLSKTAVRGIIIIIGCSAECQACLKTPRDRVACARMEHCCGKDCRVARERARVKRKREKINICGSANTNTVGF